MTASVVDGAALIEPGTGWPTDRATPDTPVAVDADGVRALAGTAATVKELDARSSVCRACPRLVAWREQVAADKRASYASEVYWGRPVTGWGPADARIAIMGLAPAAHGGNRTGRIFTGDRSGDFLFAALHRAGLARTATSVRADDGQQLIDTRVTLGVRCAPPANRPTPQERDTCSPWLVRELQLLTSVRAVVVLGGFGWASLWPALRGMGMQLPARLPPFAHGAEVRITTAGGRALTLLGCYHVSQQNTFTGRLTPAMLDAVLRRAGAVAPPEVRLDRPMG